MGRRFDLTEPNLTKKLARFADVARLDNCVEVPGAHVIEDFRLRGHWAEGQFGNTNPITLELACGRGEYSVGQARLFPNRNFIGLDIKGNRLWKGATEAKRDGLANVAYLRTRIDFIDRLFAKDEVAEIWIIFPDPQPQKDRKKLTSPLFLERYRQILRPGGTVNLKTDNFPLWEFTMEVIREQGLTVHGQSTDLYADLASKVSPFLNEREDVLRIRTYYEGRWLQEGRKINFVSFSL